MTRTSRFFVAAATLASSLVPAGILQLVVSTPAGAGVVDLQIGAVAKSIGQLPLTSFSPSTASSRSFLKGKLTAAKSEALRSGCGDALALVQVVEGAITNKSATVKIVGAAAQPTLNRLLSLEGAVRGAQSSSTCGQPADGSTSPSSIVTKVSASDLSHVSFSLLIPAVQFTSPSLKTDQTYIAVSQPGAGRAAGVAIGQPDLPAASLTVALPKGTRPQVSVTGSTGYTMVLPTPVAPLEDSPPAATQTGSQLPVDQTSFVLDTGAYQSQSSLPELVVQPPTYSQRGLDLSAISIPTVQYTPASGQIEVLTSVDVDVTFCDAEYSQSCVPNGQGASVGQGASASEFGDASLVGAANAPFDNLWQAEVANWSQVITSNLPDLGAIQRCGEQMMLITDPAYLDRANSYAADRTAHGVVTKVFSTGDIGAGLGDIHDAIDAEMTASCATKPSFVLLFGNVSQIPTFEVTLPFSFWENGTPPSSPACAGGAAVATDQPYGFIHQWGSFNQDLRGTEADACRSTFDLTPDLFIGRIESPTQQTLDRLLAYADSPTRNASAYKGVTGAELFQTSISMKSSSEAASFCLDAAKAATTSTANQPFVKDSEFVGNLAAAAGKTFRRVAVANTCPGINPAADFGGAALPSALLMPSGWTTNSAAPGAISASVASGSSIIWHADHGYTDATGWWQPAWRDTDLPGAGLSTSPLAPLIWSSDCDSGKFDGGGMLPNVDQTSSDFSDTALRSGALAHIGASRESPIYEDGVLLQSMGRALFPELGNVFRAILGSAPVNPVQQLGPLLEAAKLDLNGRAPTSWGAPLMDLEFNLFGDPSISLQRDVPKLINQRKLQVSIANLSTAGGTRISVSTGSAALPSKSAQVVQAWKAGVLLASAYLDPSTHSALLVDELGGPHVFDGATITVTGDGLIPLTKVVTGL